MKRHLQKVEEGIGPIVRIEWRVKRVEDGISRQRRDSAAMLVMMRDSSSVFDQRLLSVEEAIRLLKKRMGI